MEEKKKLEIGKTLISKVLGKFDDNTEQVIDLYYGNIARLNNENGEVSLLLKFETYLMELLKFLSTDEGLLYEAPTDDEIVNDIYLQHHFDYEPENDDSKNQKLILDVTVIDDVVVNLKRNNLELQFDVLYGNKLGQDGLITLPLANKACVSAKDYVEMLKHFFTTEKGRNFIQPTRRELIEHLISVDAQLIVAN